MGTDGRTDGRTNERKGGRKDGRTDMNRLIDAFRNSANARKIIRGKVCDKVELLY